MQQKIYPLYNKPGMTASGNEQPLQPGEIRVGDARLFPVYNEHGEVTMRFHYTDEVEMAILKARYMRTIVCMWVIIAALFLTAVVILVIHFRPVTESEAQPSSLSPANTL
jgi:hypothetical protein